MLYVQHTERRLAADLPAHDGAAKPPTGWSAPTTSLTDTFEGLNVYRSLADGQYYLVVEDLQDNRYYELWTSSSAGGSWTRVAEKWAWHGNLVFNGSAWTNNVSHGDILRPA